MKYKNRFVASVWILMLAVFWVQYMESMNKLEAFLLAAGIVGLAYPLTTYLSKRLLRRAMENRNMIKFSIQFLAITLIYAFSIPLIIRLLSLLETFEIFPISEFMTRWNSSGHEYLNTLLTSLVINLSFCGLSFFEQNLRLQKELADSSLQILQAQINPHFMFNVLNHVNVLIRKEPDLASAVLVQYTNILRYQLYNGKKEAVSIRQEIEFLKDFIEIESMRWKNTLDVKCNWDIEDETLTFPPLLLITFVENAFKHVSRSKTDKGYVHINMTEKGKTLILTVENSKYISDSPSKKEESGIGLENVKKRLSILYSNKYDLLIKDSEVSYLVTLTLKL